MTPSNGGTRNDAPFHIARNFFRPQKTQELHTNVLGSTASGPGQRQWRLISQDHATFCADVMENRDITLRKKLESR
jgi:hypothetical protein